jgi:hypothetical protein
MLRSQVPTKFPIGFASSAGGSYIRAVPQTPSGTPGQASLQTGFPPENFNPVASGGVPPFGQDFNGLLNQITLWNQWQAASCIVPYDGTFQTAIGGYPQGAVVGSLVTVGLVWESIVDNNLTNPDAAGAGWVALSPISVANPLLWVRTDGNDNNSGSANDSAHAFQTIAGALSAAASRLNLTGRTLTIELGLAGTYQGTTINNIPNVLITTAGAAASYIINNSGLGGANGAINVFGCSVTLNNLTLSNVNGTTHTLQSSFGASVTLTGTVVFGGTAGGAGIADIRCFSGGSIVITGTVNFDRSVGYAMYAQGSGASISAAVGSNIAAVGGPIWGSAGIAALENATIELAGNAPTGSATGKRYDVELNGVINTFSGGANYWPGSVAGSFATQGLYV